MTIPGFPTGTRPSSEVNSPSVSISGTCSGTCDTAGGVLRTQGVAGGGECCLIVAGSSWTQALPKSSGWHSLPDRRRTTCVSNATVLNKECAVKQADAGADNTGWGVHNGNAGFCPLAFFLPVSLVPLNKSTFSRLWLSRREHPHQRTFRKRVRRAIPRPSHTGVVAY